MAGARIRTTFAGVTFSGYAYAPNHVTVPMPAFAKILKSGKIRIRKAYEYTDDYAFDAANNYGRRDGVPPESVYEQAFGLFGGKRPSLLYLNPQKRVVTYCPYMNACYEIEEEV